MVRTPSTMRELGSFIPEFELDSLTSEKFSPDSFREKKGLLVMFISKHCPFVKHIVAELTRLSSDFFDSDLGLIAISSNEIENYPDDSPQNLAIMAKENDLLFPICFDETQDVAKSFEAACTPDFFLYDNDGLLVYRGQLDGSRPGNEIPTDGKDLRGAIGKLLVGEKPSTRQIPSIGCNIKWKPGNEPEYFG